MTPSLSSTVRPSAVAGAWYPGDPLALRHTIEGYLDEVRPAPLPGSAVALISPHAGYAYSGPTAAYAYAQVRGASFRRVILVGPLHRPIWGSRLGPFMVAAEAAYQTPLGDVPLDTAFLAELGRRVPLASVRGDEEHSLEIELPFLQVALGEFSLVPIMLGEHIADPGATERVAALSRALAELCDAGTLLVCSSDLSHLYNYADVVSIDGHLTELLSAFDLEALVAAFQNGEVHACGAVGMVTALQTASLLGARGVQVLAYATSGDMTGDKRPGTYTVGYLAAAAYR